MGHPPLHRCLRLAPALLLALPACQPSGAPPTTSGEPPTILLSERFAQATVEGEPPEITGFAVIDWRFDRPFEPLPEVPEPEEPADKESSDEEDDAKPAEPEPEPDEETEDPALSAPGVIVHGVEAVLGIEKLAVEGGTLRGEVTGPSALRFERVAEGKDDIFGIDLRMRVSAGETVGLLLPPPGDFEHKDSRKDLPNIETWNMNAPLIPGDSMQEYRIELSRPRGASELRHLLLQPSNAKGATFEVESLRLVTMREHIAGQAANVDWRGLGEVYRQSLLMHGTEKVHFDVHLPSRPWLDLALGTLEAHATTFIVHVEQGGSTERLLRRTVTTEDRWEECPLDLSRWADRRVRLTFEVRSDNDEQVGLFGSLAIRNRSALPLLNGDPLTEAPTGVIFVLVDTLRRDHLDAYGYERATAPFLARIAAEGARFEDTITQGTWTKLSVPSILSSTYPTSNGIKEMANKLPMSVTTLAENFQRAGYATFATSSVVFSGRSSNLHQGIDVLHERGSVGKLEHSGSKTARTYVDRLVDWIEDRREQPFFAFLHVFDPHSPFETYNPYVGLWSAPEAEEEHKKDIEKIQKVEKDIKRGGGDLLPDREDFEKAEVPTEPFVAREIDWYDESIRAMDAEIARLFERLEELGLADRTLVVFTSDHGEEFLEHGRHFHGNNAYGEMTNVPLLFWGPAWVPAGSVVQETVQSIDVYPTVLELCGLPSAPGAQGQSLVPLIESTPGFHPRPAFTVRYADKKDERKADDLEQYAMVSGGYRLIHNTLRPDGHPEFELYDHVKDPINMHDLAAEMPERVAAMAKDLALWRKWAEANKIEGAGESGELSPADLEQLRALGYAGD